MLMSSMAELKKMVVTACHILDAEGIMDELGHFSARVPGEARVVMNGKVSPGQATEEDIVTLDLKGNTIEGRLEPAKEIPLHLTVYEGRPDVMAVAHTHSPMIVALSIAGVPLKGMDNLGATVFGKEAPLYLESGLVDTFDMGYRIVEAMGSSRVIVLKGHGDIVAGGSIEECCISALWAEKAARVQHQAMLVGEPQLYSEEEVAKVRRQVIDGKAFQRAWNYYQWRLGRS
jgi:ribulose-5-phosphate 4-epimerase/fuculose-1-phosphate aldolase